VAHNEEAAHIKPPSTQASSRNQVHNNSVPPADEHPQCLRNGKHQLQQHWTGTYTSKVCVSSTKEAQPSTHQKARYAGKSLSDHLHLKPAAVSSESCHTTHHPAPVHQPTIAAPVPSTYMPYIVQEAPRPSYSHRDADAPSCCMMVAAPVADLLPYYVSGAPHNAGKLA
jgi:hypothetical protein